MQTIRVKGFQGGNGARMSGVQFPFEPHKSVQPDLVLPALGNDEAYFAGPF